MRDLMILGALFFFVSYALRNTFAAYLMWGWTALIAIDEYLYGFMTAVRFNFTFALIALLMLLMRKDGQRNCWSWGRTEILLLLWLLQGTLSAAFAYPGLAANWDLYIKFVKIFIFVLVMPFVVSERYHFHALVIVVALGLGFHGVVEGLKYFASGGGHRIQGLSKFGDNNHFAVTVMLSIPLIFYLFQQFSQRILKYSMLAAIVAITASVVGTNSRGGLIGLLVMFIWMLFVSKRKTLGIVVLSIGLITLISFAPESWLGRMETIKSADEDSSFMQRVEAWQVSSAIALENPLLGGGFHAVQHQYVWDMFKGRTGLLGFLPTFDEPSNHLRAAHSIYFEVLGDFGFVGLFLFLAILLNIVKNCLQVKRLAKSLPGELVWAENLANALLAILIAYAIGGAGVSLAYSETILTVAMLAELLKRHILKIQTNAENFR